VSSTSNLGAYSENQKHRIQTSGSQHHEDRGMGALRYDTGQISYRDVAERVKHKAYLANYLLDHTLAARNLKGIVGMLIQLNAY